MVLRGIDVSKWQGSIDFAQVKGSGVEFVIIKAGSGAGTVDKCFEDNYRKAKEAGLHVGAYWYSYADSFHEAVLEAEMCIETLKGKQFDYPVFYDIEEKKQISSGRDFCSWLIKSFCDRLEQAGYFAGFYTSAGYAKSVVSDEVRNRYCYWCAQWSDSCMYIDTCGLWQYTSNGYVPGINGRVDMDWSFKDFPSVIRNGGYNGYGKSTESQRDMILDQARAWIGKNEADGSHREIIDIYNSHKPLARGYAVKYTDAWCATFVSALAIKCGLTGIIPTECSCNQMAARFMANGTWEEDDGYTPRPGDIIFYDWQDSGSGDNTGVPDHVGIVETVQDSVITVIEGNIKDSVSRRTIKVNRKNIRGYGVPGYAGDEKTIDQLAEEVLSGKWGNGEDRKKRLTAAGYDAAEVQKRVNEIFR